MRYYSQAYGHVVRVDHTKNPGLSEMIEWCKEKFGTDNTRRLGLRYTSWEWIVSSDDGVAFIFDTEKKASHFILRWGD